MDTRPGADIPQLQPALGAANDDFVDVRRRMQNMCGREVRLELDVPLEFCACIELYPRFWMMSSIPAVIVSHVKRREPSEVRASS